MADKPTRIIYLTLPTDQPGTCPSCRSATLRYGEGAYDVGAPKPVVMPNVECPRCGFSQRIASHQIVYGAVGERKKTPEGGA